jgi:hypothetical protein
VWLSFIEKPGYLYAQYMRLKSKPFMNVGLENTVARRLSRNHSLLTI